MKIKYTTQIRIINGVQIDSQFKVRDSSIEVYTRKLDTWYNSKGETLKKAGVRSTTEQVDERYKKGEFVKLN